MIREGLKHRLEGLHLESFAWALHCCYADRIAAEEVLQITYLKILEKKAKFNGKSQFKTWLFAVIRFTAIDFYQQSKRFQQIQKQSLSKIQQSTTQETDYSTIFNKALKQLSPQQNQLLHLVFYQNLTIQEAADIMHLQIGTARTHYKRGKIRLRKYLEQKGLAVNGKFIIH